MFSEHIIPRDVLKFVYNSMLSVLDQMMKHGFPPTLTPSHTASVYVVVDAENPDRVGIGRSEPYLLTRHNKSDWSVIGLYNLECSADDWRIPIGCFFGTVMSEVDLCSIVLRENAKPSPNASYFVGILISPCGSESVGYYAKLDDLENPSTFEDDPLTYGAFEFLNSLYTPIEGSDETVH